MNLKNWVESALNDINRPLSWLAAEMDRTTEGLKLSIDKETMKFSDLKKMIAILHKPITVQLNGNTTIQSVKGNYNQQNIEGTINEPNAKYKYETHYSYPNSTGT